LRDFVHPGHEGPKGLGSSELQLVEEKCDTSVVLRRGLPESHQEVGQVTSRVT
jgi:hypothetical protein